MTGDGTETRNITAGQLAPTLRIILTLAVLSGVLGAFRVCFAQVGASQLDKQKREIVRKEKRLSQYESDFATFGMTSVGQGLESELAIDLSTASHAASNTLDEAKTLLDIHDALVCADDREMVRRVVQERLRSLSRELEVDCKQVSNAIPFLKGPSLAQEALRVRQELQDGEDLLDSIRIP